MCAGQHTTDRAIAWDAAREVALAVPVVPGGGVGDRGWWWLVAGLAAFGLVGVGVRFAAFLPAFLAERAKRRATTPQVTAPSRVRLPTINTTTCIGCYACVDACPYNVLEIERYVAVVARPEACCGLTLCEQRCPNGSLKITEGEPIGERPGVNDDLESQEVPGLFLAGDITGLPLIKNAILQGAHAMSKIADRLKKGRNGDPNLLDAIVIGAGPAGISAALRAKEEGVSCEVIEQGNVAQSIRSFPRGKLVFDQPLDLPVTGKLWMKESTKEELLGHWLRIVRQEKLVIREETRMTRVTRTPEGTFVVTTEPTEGGGATGHGAEGRAAVPEPHCATERRCRFVVIAVGQRGSPRRLPVELPPEIEARVHYHLADAKSFAEQRVIVVGLGDVAMETAIALARQPGTTVTIVHRGDDFRRGQGRNIQSVRRLVGDGKIALVFRAEVTGFSGQAMTVEIRGGGAPRTEVLPFDAVFVMIGSIPPKATLKSAGIRTVAEAEAGTFPTLVSPRR